jgi:hypothetical protein
MQTIKHEIEVVRGQGIDALKVETLKVEDLPTEFVTLTDRDLADFSGTNAGESSAYFSVSHAIALEVVEATSCQHCIHFHGGEAYGPSADGIQRTCGFHPYGWDRSDPCPNHWGGGYGARNRRLE